MCQLVESLKLKNGQIQHLEYHQDRMNRTRIELFPGSANIELEKEISIPKSCTSGIFKVRVLYGETLEKIEIDPYIIRTILSLKVIHHERIDYHLKYTDRQILQDLFAQRGTCDDIIIIKNGFVTDSFAGNLLFFDGENWVTPTTPLLKGTKRQFLLDHGIISEKDIREDDIRYYQKIGIINALIDFDEMPVISLGKIIF
jgi:4-amino-4-deoxychorismate lyase